MSKESKKSEANLGTVTKNRAIKIFEALGFQTADKWDVERLQKKLVKLSTLVEEAELDKNAKACERDSAGTESRSKSCCN